MSEFVVNRTEILARNVDAHLDAKIVHIIDIPGTRVTHYLPVARLDKEGSLPEGLGKRIETERSKETLAIANHFFLVDLLTLQDLGQVIAGVSVRRGQDWVEILPALRPHIAEKMRGNRAFRIDHTLAILLDQLTPNVRVKRHVQRLHLVPQAVEFFR